MARQRVMVGELNAPTEVTPVARPVDTYVSPEKPIVQPSPLTQFLDAISPLTNLMEEEAKKAKAQQERDEFNGKRANEQHQAEMAAINLTARLKEDWINNQNNWLSLTTEEAAERVSRHYSDYRMNLDEAQINPLALQAFDQKVDQDKLLFMFNNFGPEKRKRNIEQQDQQFNDTIRRAGSVAEDDQIVPAMVDAFNQHVVVTGGDYRRANDLVIATALVESKRGRTNYLKFVDAIQTRDGKSLRSIDRYAKDFNTIDANVAAFLKKKGKLGEDARFQSALSARVEGYTSTKQQGVLGIGTVFTDPVTGKETKITADDVLRTYEANNALKLQQELAFADALQEVSLAERDESDPDITPEAIFQEHWSNSFEEFYTPFQVLPTEYKNAINSGAYALTTGNTDEDKQMAAQAFQAYRTVESFSSGLTKRSGTLKEDDLLRMRVLETMTGPMAREFDQALNAVQGQLFKEKGSKIKIQDIIDNTEGWAWWDDSKFEDITNPQEVLTQYKDVVQALVMAEGMDVKKAMDIAANYLNDDWLIVESTNGIKTAVPLLNTDIKQFSGQEGAVSTYLAESMLLPEVGSLARDIRGEGAGLSIKVNPSNPNAVDVVVLDQDGGLRPFVINTIAYSELGTLSQGMLQERLRQEANKKISMDRNAEIYTTINLAELPNLSDEEITARVGMEPEQIEALKTVRTNINNMLGISEDDAKIAAENQASLVLEDMARFEAQETDEANLVEEKPFFEIGEVNLMNAFTDMFKDETVKESLVSTAAQQGIPADKAEGFLASVVDSVSSFFTTEAQADEATPLDNVIQTVVSTKGGTPDEVMELALRVAWHESKLKNVRQTTSTGKQDGAGRGYFQYEGVFGDKKSGFNTAVSRAKRDLKVKPEWLLNIKKGDDALSLNFEQQATLFLLDKLGGEGNLGTILSKPKGPERDAALKAFWRDYHWQGGKSSVRATPKSIPETKVPARSRSWDESMKTFDLAKAKELLNK
jgi:hypothetical protein